MTAQSIQLNEDDEPQTSREEVVRLECMCELCKGFPWQLCDCTDKLWISYSGPEGLTALSPFGSRV